VNQVFQVRRAYREVLVSVDFQVAMVRKKKSVCKLFMYLLCILGLPGVPGERVNKSFFLKYQTFFFSLLLGFTRTQWITR
jgi:hypothetical protein